MSKLEFKVAIWLVCILSERVFPDSNLALAPQRSVEQKDKKGKKKETSDPDPDPQNENQTFRIRILL